MVIICILLFNYLLYKWNITLRTIALDTETTGFEFSEGHRMVEIGCIEMINLVRTGKKYHVYIDPERSMPADAQRIHGLSSEFLTGKPKFKEVAEGFLKFIADSPLVIHNAAFDVKFLNAELENIGLNKLQNTIIDTLTLSRKRLKIGRHNLDALCNYFKIDKSKRTVHGALLDADLLAQVYLELEGGANYAMDLTASTQAKPASLKIENLSGLVNKIEIVKPTETEICDNEKYMAKYDFH